MTLLTAAGHTTAAGAVASLSEGVMHMMVLSKLKALAVVLVVAAGFGAAGLGWAYQDGGAGEKKQSVTRPVPGGELLGTWQLVAAEVKDKKGPTAEEIKQMRFTFTKDTLTIVVGDESIEARYTIDPAKKPAPLDLTIVKGPERELNKSSKAIYRLRDKELQVCIPDGDGDRPTEFAAGDKVILFTFKRADKMKVDKAPQPPPLKAPEARQARVELERAKAMQAEAAARVRVHMERVKAAQAELDRAQAQLRLAEANFMKIRDALNPDAAARALIAENLKRIGIGMHNYHDTLTVLPTATIYGKDGKALLSWRVAILPYIDHQELYNQFHLDEPWDSEHNLKLLGQMPDVFKSPDSKGKQTTTRYQVFTGKDTPFHGDKKLRLTQFFDGTSNTILAVEAGTAVPWTKPEDLPYDAKKDLPKLGGVLKDGFHALMADGAVQFVPRSVDPLVLRAAITHAGGEPFSVMELSPPPARPNP
jgi:uncharacterized protein (TIGR03067 family)